MSKLKENSIARSIVVQHNFRFPIVIATVLLGVVSASAVSVSVAMGLIV